MRQHSGVRCALPGKREKHPGNPRCCNHSWTRHGPFLKMKLDSRVIATDRDAESTTAVSVRFSISAVPMSAVGHPSGAIVDWARRRSDNHRSASKDLNIFSDVVNVVFNQIQQSLDVSRVAMNMSCSEGCIVLRPVKN